MKASRIMGLGALLLFCAYSAFAQDTASITGTVRDPSGAIVPAAEVKIVSNSIGLTRASTTNADGAYLAPGLPAGTYDLSVTAKGFKSYQAKGVILQVAEKARVDVTLQVGQINETVLVAGENVAQVETQSSDLSGVVTGTQISQLELNGRSFTKLVALVPGVSDQTGSDSGGVGLDANVSFSINGGRTEYNNWQVDGANNMDTGSNATLDVFPNEDSIAEFRVFTSNYSAAYGRNGSGNVEIVTKAGTNRFHGSVWEYLRNDFFNANDWFDNNAGNPRPAYKRHDFGFTVGGPVIFPGYNRNRDKTFFFYSENWRRERNPFSFNQQVPSVAERGGDFTDVCPGSECPVDPATGNPFPGNTVPIDPNAQALLDALISVPNVGSGANSFFVGSVTEPLTWRQDLVRIDHNFNEKFRLMGRYIHDSYSNVDPTVAFIGNPFPTIQTKIGTPGTSFVLHLTTAASPTLLNEFIFSYSADHLFLDNTGNFQVPSGFTMTSLFGTGPGGVGLAQLPAVSLANGNAYGGGFTINPGFMPWENANPTYGFHDTVTMNVGSHNLQFGGDFIAIQKNEPNAPTGVGLGGALTFDETNSAVNTTGNSFADFLTGQISSYSQTSAIVRYYYRYKIFEPYFQDDWHVSKKLTLNLGLRVSLFPTNRDISKTAFNFDPSKFSTGAIVPIDVDGSITGVAGSLIPDTNALGNPNGNPFNGFVQCGGAGGNSQVPAPVLALFPSAAVAGTSLPGCQKGHYVNWGPRFGFAFDPKGNEKMAIRAGYGIFQEYTNGNEANAESLEGTPPRVLTASQPNIAPGVGGCAAATGYTCIGGGGALPPPLVNNFPPATIEGKIFWPYVQQWHLDLQRELPGHTVGTISYVGSKGTHLTDVRDQNQMHTLPLAQDPYGPGQPLTQSDCNNGTANGVVPTPGTQLAANFAVACGDNADPFRPFSGISALEFLETQANSNYHALQISIRRDIGALQLSGAYTYSHSIDNSSDRGDTTFTDSYNLSANRASSNFDQRHILNISWVYDLPFFRKSSGLTKTLLGGWQWSGIIKSQSGVPVNVDNTIFGDNAGSGNGVEGRSSVSRPDLVGEPHSASCTPTPGPGPLLFNPCAFTDPRGLTFGSTPRNFLNLPYRTNFDMGIYKRFAIKESSAVEFRWETFNTFNHTQFSSIDSDFGSSTFLTATSTHDPRIMQFALKFIF
jgi:Carboxypeptidase regulatory-like domain/TonB-dependent Receptor Plug Domain